MNTEHPSRLANFINRCKALIPNQLVMKKPIYHSLLTFVILITIALTGCEKDDNVNDSIKTALLTAHVWNFDDYSISSTEYQATVYAMIAALTDVTWSFAADGTWTQSESDISFVLASGTWEWNADETKLILGKGTENEHTYDLITLTSDVLEMGMLVSGDNSLTIRWVK